MVSGKWDADDGDEDDREEAREGEREEVASSAEGKARCVHIPENKTTWHSDTPTGACLVAPVLSPSILSQ